MQVKPSSSVNASPAVYVFLAAALAFLGVGVSASLEALVFLAFVGLASGTSSSARSSSSTSSFLAAFALRGIFDDGESEQARYTSAAHRPHCNRTAGQTVRCAHDTKILAVISVMSFPLVFLASPHSTSAAAQIAMGTCGVHGV